MNSLIPAAEVGREVMRSFEKVAQEQGMTADELWARFAEAWNAAIALDEAEESELA